MTARPLIALLALLAGGCPWVPDSELELVAGELPVEPGATLIFRFSCQDQPFGDWEVRGGPGHCGGSWFVDDVPGGTAESGTITSCGEYTAPVARPSKPPEIVVYEGPWRSQCFDCCAASVTLGLDGYSTSTGDP